MADTEPMMCWLDFSAHGVKLRLFRLTDNSVNLVLTGLKPDTSEWDAVQALGFVPSASGKTLVRQGSDVQTRALREIFPNNRVRDLPASAVWMAVKGQAPISAPATGQRDRAYVGLNRHGYDVRTRDDGSRFTVIGGETIDDQLVARLIAEGQGSEAAEAAAALLRVPQGIAPAHQELAIVECADAFVASMLDGRNMDSADLRQFGGTIHAEPGRPVTPLEVSDLRLRGLQEAVEAAMQRALATHHPDAGEAAYRFAVGLTERQPVFAFRTSTSVANQQYSTPLPMSIAAQILLGDTSKGKVFEPTIGNGSLVTALPADTAITGVEIDPARVGRVNTLLANRPQAQIVTGDVLNVGSDLPDDFDFVISNPPFGGLQPAVRFGDVRVNRIDHLIALNALARRKENGRGVFIIAADRESLMNPGKIAGGSKSFFAWLADHYEIEDAVELDGALYRKQGSEYPVRMVTVGRRRTPEQAADLLRTKAARLGDRLPVVNTWDELWTHTRTLAHRLQEGQPNKHPTVYDRDARLRRELIADGQQLANIIGLQPQIIVTGKIEDKWEIGTHGADDYKSLQVYTPRYTNKRQFAVLRFFDRQYTSGTYDSPELAERALRALTRDEFTAIPASLRNRAVVDDDTVASVTGDAVKDFGTAMRQAGLEMDGLDPRQWSVDLGSGHEVHARLNEDSVVDVTRFEAGEPAEEWSGPLGAEVTRQVREYVRMAINQPVALEPDADENADGEEAAVQHSEEDDRAHAIAYVRWLRQEHGIQSIDQIMPGIRGGRAFQTGRPLVQPGHMQVDGRASFRLKDLWAASEFADEAKQRSAPAESADAARGEPHAPPATAGGEVNTITTAEPSDGASPATQPAATVDASANPAGEPQASAEPDEAVINDYQAPYLPSSRLNEPTAMIPRNLEGPVRRALARLTEEIGMDVDTYVASKLQMSPEEMELAFSAEQVDAIALAIKRTEEGRGFINGDQTGQGKGRVLAALARYAVLNNVPVVFNTEKANLFSDFWRDLKDIDSAHLFRPLILNDGEAIRNMETGKVEFRSIKPSELKSMMDGGMSLADSGYNLMLSTYSQFNREAGVSKKAAWLPTAARGAMMLLDESHVAAGDSNTAVNMGIAIEHAGSGVYSSATFAKNAKNMRAYAKVFPASVSLESLADTLQAGGEPLQEILSSMLGEEGVFIRREHDLSKLEFNVILTEQTRERDEEWADALSDALRSMAYFSGDVTRVMKRMDKEIKKQLKDMPEAARKGNRMGVSYQGFGSRLYNILRQFSLAIKVDTVADQAISAMHDQRKPVFVLEQTFEALLKESLAESLTQNMMAGEAGAGGELETPSVAAQIAANVATTGMQSADQSRTIDALSFRDLMGRIAGRLEYIYVRDDYGNGHYEHVLDQAKNDDELRALKDLMREIKEKIGKLPDIPVSPIDTIRQKLTEAGYTHGEISGRQFQTDPLPSDPSKIQVTPRPDQRIQSLAEFNNGGIDALTLTRAGSTGLSAHSSAKFGDQRQRELIELQIANNVAERVQFFGRVNRRGQVNSPRITTVVSTLPSEMRVLAMQNAKLRKLSANTQSNRNNQAEMREVPDILNPVGNEICRRYLEENPDIAALLDIDPEEQGASDDEAWFANKLTGRIALLPVARQKAVYADLSRTFNETLKELEARGENPFQTTVHDWKAKIVSKERFRTDTTGGSRSVFDEPVYLARVEWEVDLVPYTSEDIKHMIERSRRHLVESDNRFSLTENRYALGEHDRWQFNLEKLIKDVNDSFGQVQAKALKSLSSFNTIQDAIDAKDPNPIKNSEARRAWLLKTLPGLMPGGIMSFANEEGETVKGMVTAFFPPVERNESHLLGQYEVRVVVPGSNKHRDFTLNHLIGDEKFSLDRVLGSDYRNPLREFDVAKPGRVTYSRQVLLGNMFQAAQFSAQHGLGSAGIFTDDAGNRHRAVILYSYVTRENVMEMPVSLSKGQVKRALEAAFAEGYSVRITSESNPRDEAATVIAFDRSRPSEITIVTPGSKMHGGQVYTNDDLLALTGEFAGNRTQMRATTNFQRMEAVVDVLVDRCGRTFWIDATSANRLMPSAPVVEEVPATAQADQTAAVTGDEPTTRPARPRVAA